YTQYNATIVTINITVGRIAQSQRRAGARFECSGVIGLVLYWLLFGTGIVYYQSQLNKVWDQHRNSAPGAPVAR
ncbi:MAG: hypothetical protein ACRD1G_12325, partial [Acidimicrobiales bacterium]